MPLSEPLQCQQMVLDPLALCSPVENMTNPDSDQESDTEEDKRGCFLFPYFIREQHSDDSC